MIRSARRDDAARMMAIYSEAVTDRVYANCDSIPTDVELFRSQYISETDSRYASLVTEDRDGQVVGWGALKHFSALPCDDSIAEVAVYIAGQNRSAGLGIRMLAKLVAHAEASGFHSLIAIIIARNTASIRGSTFCDFKECVRLPRVASMYGAMEDIVWMQRITSSDA